MMEMDFAELAYWMRAVGEFNDQVKVATEGNS